MNRTRRLIATLASTALVCSAAIVPTTASASHGIKCGWVLVSSSGGSNVYNYVCSRGV